MGQTLTHGIYLPDEGERNCYDGLAANWSILDGAVGTIAEHTSQIAGKANAVHTHTKSDITDFPAYGTTAGTICEGNDSRLSDARTPVAHTHTKSDVTDLFNSANTWSETQTHSKTAISNAGEVLHCKNANVALGETPASEYQKSFMFKDKNNDNFGYFRHWYQTTGTSQFDILIRNKFTNGAPDTSGSIDFASFSLKLNADKSKEGILMGSFRPSNTNTYNLGSSSYKWKTLNGINPGALSFPKIGTTENVDFINVLGNIDASVTSAQTFVAPATGWFCITFKYNEVTACRISAGQLRADCVPMGSNDYVGCYIPVTEGVTVTVILNATAIYRARIYLCQGNV